MVLGRICEPRHDSAHSFRPLPTIDRSSPDGLSLKSHHRQQQLFVVGRMVGKEGRAKSLDAKSVV